MYAAFESLVKAAQSRDIPIFMCDMERLADGALGTLGYDYTASGIQGAHLADRILKGANPADIPFERYHKLILGLNPEVAGKLGLTLPSELLRKATRIYGIKTLKTMKESRIGDEGREASKTEVEKKRLALFLFWT